MRDPSSEGEGGERKRGEVMEITIHKCDKCGADCSKYNERVVVYFPYCEQRDLCIKCAREIFTDKKESEAK